MTDAERRRAIWVVAALLVFLIASYAAWRQSPHTRPDGPNRLEQLLYPIETNPADRFPSVRGRLQRIAISADGSRVIAVGSDGIILTSGDLGERWRSEPGGQSARLRDIAISGDGRKAVAVGMGGVILTSSDGGPWTAHNEGGSSDFYGVFVSSDGRTAIAVGQDGIIVASHDGGASWARQSSSVAGDLRSVSGTPDGRQLWAVGNSGLLKSDDDGASWSIKKPPNPWDDEFLDVAVSQDGRQVFVAGKHGLTSTRDGGRTWTREVLGNGNSISSIWLSPDGHHALAVDVGGNIFRSDNSGARWNWLDSGVSQVLNGIASFGNGDRAVAVGSGGLILTGDAAGQWHVRTGGFSNNLTAVAHSERGHKVVAVGVRGTIVSGDMDTGVWSFRASHTHQWLDAVTLTANGQQAIARSTRGAVLFSRDGGATWTEATQPNQRSDEPSSPGHKEAGTSGSSGLHDARVAAISADGRTILALPDQQKTPGAFSISLDGGRNWKRGTTTPSTVLNGGVISTDGRRVVFVGPVGEILTSADGAQTWQRRKSGTTNDLQSVAQSADGTEVVAVGDGGVILVSDDIGETWTKVAVGKRYTRYPARWYYAVLLLCALMLARGFSRSRQAPLKGAAGLAASDAPTTSLDQDRLGFAPLARGISRFLRNIDTSPPLTLAITGEWGTGKSSLMGQICDDLGTNKWRSVWFNAWHHQNEEQMLAALLVSIREHGVPPVVSADGLGFRFRLLWIRARRRLLPTLLLVAVASLIAATIVSNPDAKDWSGFLSIAKALKGHDGTPDLATLQALLPLLGIAGILVAIGRTMKAFGVDPAILLSSSVAKFRLKDASAQTSFRMRFAEQFAEVTEALAHPMTIVIDDLDRCQATTVLEVMEAVNFLTTSGRCFVIFGMATQRVQAALSLSFKDISAELSQLEHQRADPHRSQEYARDYLEKLINIEVVVPDRSDLPPSLLLDPVPQSIRDAFKGIVSELKYWGFIGLLCAAMLAGVWSSSFIKLPTSPQPAANAAKGSKTSKADITIPQPRTRANDPIEIDQAADNVIAPGDDHGISPIWFILALASLGSFAGALFLRWLRLRRLIVEDTETFKDALKIWTPVATFVRNSPRSIKRFGNRIRYLAMLQHAERVEAMPWTWQVTNAIGHKFASLLAKLTAFFRRRPARQAATGDATMPPHALSEHCVVALGAFHELFGVHWRAMVPADRAANRMAALGKNGERFETLLANTIAAYEQIEGAAWPPSSHDLDAFERSLRGVRIPGDPIT